MCKGSESTVRSLWVISSLGWYKKRPETHLGKITGGDIKKQFLIGCWPWTIGKFVRFLSKSEEIHAWAGERIPRGKGEMEN